MHITALFAIINTPVAVRGSDLRASPRNLDPFSSSLFARSLPQPVAAVLLNVYPHRVVPPPVFLQPSDITQYFSSALTPLSTLSIIFYPWSTLSSLPLPIVSARLPSVGLRYCSFLAPARWPSPVLLPRVQQLWHLLLVPPASQLMSI